MPVHDWNQVEAGDFHDFHLCWVVAISDALNTGLLPPGYMALIEPSTSRPIPDVVTPHACEPTVLRLRRNRRRVEPDGESYCGMRRARMSGASHRFVEDGEE